MSGNYQLSDLERHDLVEALRRRVSGLMEDAAVLRGEALRGNRAHRDRLVALRDRLAPVER